MERTLTEWRPHQPGIMLYFETLDLMRGLSDADVGQLVRAGADFVYGKGEPRTLGETAAIYWPIIRREVEKDMTRYAAKCRKNPKRAKTDLFVAFDQRYCP